MRRTSMRALALSRMRAMARRLQSGTQPTSGCRKRSDLYWNPDKCPCSAVSSLLPAKESQPLSGAGALTSVRQSFGAALSAARVEIWTDVDGIMTTDPKLCSEARVIRKMSFDEAAEMAHFGAKGLHPATLGPAMRENIPVHILNSRRPEGAGTKIIGRAKNGSLVSAITAKR